VTRSVPPPRRRRPGRSRWHLLLLIPVLAPLGIPWVNRLEPTLFGLPFFFWVQFALVIFAGILTAAVAFATRAR